MLQDVDRMIEENEKIPQDLEIWKKGFLQDEYVKKEYFACYLCQAFGYKANGDEGECDRCNFYMKWSDQAEKGRKHPCCNKDSPYYKFDYYYGENEGKEITLEVLRETVLIVLEKVENALQILEKE